MGQDVASRGEAGGLDFQCELSALRQLDEGDVIAAGGKKKSKSGAPVGLAAGVSGIPCGEASPLLPTSTVKAFGRLLGPLST